MSIPRFPAYEPPMVTDPDTKEQRFSFRLLRWFESLRTGVNSTPQTVTGGSVALAGKNDAIGTTPIPTGALVAGRYSLAWYLQVVTAAGVSSDAQVTVSWTRHGVTQTYAGAVVNGNTTATNEPDGPPLIHLDAGTPVSYAVAYNSNPANAMVYDLDLELQLVAADS